MKKQFLFIVLLSLVFLGLGNYSFGQLSTCGPEPTLPASPENIAAYNACIAAQTAIPSPTTTTTTSQTNAECLATCLAAPGLAAMDPTLRQDKCSQQCTTSSTTTIDTPCPSTMNSDLAGKDNAIVGLGGVSCECKPGFKNVNHVCVSCSNDDVCCGVSLSTSIPFIGNCIEDGSSAPGPGETSVTSDKAFPVLMGSLTKILVTVILIVSFVLIVVGGIMIATGNPSGGKKMIIKVVVGIALLGSSGVILRLINPNFFG